MVAYVYIDVAQKQKFIYRHNRLRDNLYNSFIIKSVTEEIPDLARETSCVSLSRHLSENHHEKYGFVYSGGGNSIIRFDTRDEARKFVRGYSGEILKAYPDLELYISLVDEAEIDKTDREEKEKTIISKLYKKADQLKDRRRARFRRWTYGIERISETGQAEYSRYNLRNYDLSKIYLFGRLEQGLKQDLDGTAVSIKITDELQKYKKKDEEGKSYIGVISIDGNKMGEMLKRISTFDARKEFSKCIESIYCEAVVTALKSRAQSFYEYGKDGSSKTIYVTPVVMAGDDVCLIMGAEHAIETAAMIVKNIQDLSAEERYRSCLSKYLKEKEESLKACAGVAIVKYNYPFFEAVKTAEALCERAKESIHRIRTEEAGPANASFIDWEVVMAQVSALEDNELKVHSQYKEKYHIKPLRIDAQSTPLKDGIYSYDSFIILIEKLAQTNKESEDKKISKSALESLKKVIYSGWEQYKLFFEMNQTYSYKNIALIVQEVYGDAQTSCAAVKEVKDGYPPVYTYILNDVLDVLPFIDRDWGE